MQRKNLIRFQKPQAAYSETGNFHSIIADDEQDIYSFPEKCSKTINNEVLCTAINTSGKSIVVCEKPCSKNRMVSQETPNESKIETDMPLKRLCPAAYSTGKALDGEIEDSSKAMLKSFVKLVSGSECKIHHNKQLKVCNSSHDLFGSPSRDFMNEDSIQSFVQQSIDNRYANQHVFSTRELQDILKFRTIPFSFMPRNPVKIGEASFSEVFLVNENVYKIIPFNEHYGMEAFCKEVFVLDTLKEEKGMCRIIDKFLIKGKYSKEYIKAWRNYKSISENIDPSEYKQSQVFGVIVMNNCGNDLERYQFKDYNEVVWFISQLLSAVHILEAHYKFEHRDLHWGNIMVKDSEIFLIDFNFSRLETKKIVYTDLNQEQWLFEGDPSVDPQFGVYKKMKVSCKNDWMSFNEKSNLLWIVYLLDKLHLKIKTLKVSEDRFKATRIVQFLENKAKRCKNTQELLGWFEQHTLNK